MVRKLKIVGLIAMLVAVPVLYQLFSSLNEVKYGVAVADGDPSLAAVNDTAASCTQREPAQAIPQSFKKAAENEQLELYVEEESVAIAVKEKCSGYTWFSYDVGMDMAKAGYSADMIAFIRSGISIVTYDKFTPGRRTVLKDKAELAYRYKDDGFTVTIDFVKPKIRFDVEVKLIKGDLTVRVPKESVEEYNPKLWTAGNEDISLSEIIVMPFFGSTTRQENGYMVIPDGSGAIVRLGDEPKYATGYSAPVYGLDAGYETTIKMNARGVATKPLERITLPIFGIVHEEQQHGVLVISESGASHATFNYVSKKLQTAFYQSYFTYNYRTAYAQFQSRVKEDQFILGFQKKPNPFDLVQRYVFLNGDKADYVGVAKGYRDFLAKTGGLPEPQTPSGESVPMKIDFLNNEVKTGTLGDENVSTTSYEQAQSLVRRLKEDGFKNLNVSFKTFLKQEHRYDFEAMKNLGGESGLRKALDDFAANGVRFRYYADFARSYVDKTRNTASKLNRKSVDVLNEGKSLYNYVNNPKYFATLTQKDTKALKQRGIQGLALDGFGSSLITHYDNGTIGYSHESMVYVADALKQLKDSGMTVGLYLPDAYQYKYLDEFYEAPVSSSELIFADATVPLVSLVVSGLTELYSPYMNFSSNDTDAMLRLIEFGVYPSFVLTGESTYELKRTASGDVYTSEYGYLKDRIAAYYANINRALAPVIGQEMVGHRILGDGVVQVKYGNGQTIIINYGSSEYVDGAVKIQPKGFVIL